jgi:hypothetical protein
MSRGGYSQREQVIYLQFRELEPRPESQQIIGVEMQYMRKDRGESNDPCTGHICDVEPLNRYDACDLTHFRVGKVV